MVIIVACYSTKGCGWHYITHWVIDRPSRVVSNRQRHSNLTSTSMLDDVPSVNWQLVDHSVESWSPLKRKHACFVRLHSNVLLKLNVLPLVRRRLAKTGRYNDYCLVITILNQLLKSSYMRYASIVSRTVNTLSNTLNFSLV